MKYVWGIDLGVGSIGLAVWLYSDDLKKPLELVDGIAHIFPSSIGNERRREKRSARTQNQRKSERLKVLKEKLTVLLDVAISFPDDHCDLPLTLPDDHPECKGKPIHSRTDRVHLREKGLREQLSAGDFARALYHIAGERGKRLTRGLHGDDEGDSTDDKKKSDTKASAKSGKKKKSKEKSEAEKANETLDALSKLTAANGGMMATPCQLLLQDRLNGAPIRQRRGAEHERVFLRQWVRDETERLLAKQQEWFPVFKDPAKRADLVDEIFWEKDPIPPKVGTCMYGIETAEGALEKRLPRADDRAEIKRLYEAANNIRLISRQNGKSSPLTIEQRDKVIGELMTGKTVTAARLRTLLQLGKGADAPISSLEEAYTIWKSRKGQKRKRRRTGEDYEILGHRIIKIFSDAGCFDYWNAADTVTRQLLTEKLRTEDDVLEFKTWFNAKTDLSDDAIELLATASVPSGFTSTGATATEQIIDHLRDNLCSLRDAEDALGLKSERELPELKGDDPLPYYAALFPDLAIGGTKHPADPLEKRFGKIPNPVVHQTLNQLRKLAKTYLRKYGKPARIHVELARDLNKSAEEREEVRNNQLRRHKKRKAWAKELRGAKIRVTRTSLRKYELMERQGNTCLYSQSPITLANLDQCQIDHILPRSLTLDDSFSNLALVTQQANKDKANAPPAVAFANGYKTLSYEQILRHVEATRPECRWRFAEDAIERFKNSDFLPNRFLNDTRYLGKVAAQYLGLICFNPDKPDGRKVIITTGRMTHMLNDVWGLDQLTRRLMIEEGRLDPNYFEDPYIVKSEALLSLAQALNVKDADKIEDEDDLIGAIKDKQSDLRQKIRWDHRHHLVDAITIGATTNSDIQRLMTYFGKEGSGKDEVTAATDWLQTVRDSQQDAGLSWDPDFAKIVYRFLTGEVGKGDRAARPAVENTHPIQRVTHRPQHNPVGQLHNETFYKLIARVEGKENFYIASVRTDLQKLTNATTDDKVIKDINAIRLDPTLRASLETAGDDDVFGAWGGSDRANAVRTLETSLNAIADQLLAAFDQEPEKDAEGKNRSAIARYKAAAKSVTEATGQRRILKLSRQTLRIIEGADKRQSNRIPNPNPRRAVALGNNHCLTFWRRTDGAIETEVISALDANNKDYQPAYKIQGGEHLLDLHKNDIVEMDSVRKPEKLRQSCSPDQSRTSEDEMTSTQPVRRLYRVKSFSQTSGSQEFVFLPLAEARSPNGKDAASHAGLRLQSSQDMINRNIRLVRVCADGSIGWRSHKVG